jgi:hypothetical protein
MPADGLGALVFRRPYHQLRVFCGSSTQKLAVSDDVSTEIPLLMNLRLSSQ